MIVIFDASSDVSEHLKEKSLKMSDQMSSRRNTATFSLIDQKIEQGKAVRIYETLDLTQSSASGTDLLYVEDTYEDCDKFIAGDEILIDIRGAGEKTYTILAVDHSAKTVQLTTNLTADVTKGTHLVGRIIFGGICIKNPDNEIGKTGTFEYAISCDGWKVLYDRKMVVQQFIDMYLREILGRIVYFFCSTDTTTTLETFESAWTESGVANTMADETTDRIVGTKSQKTSTSAAGTALWTQTISSKDISAYMHARFWWKIAAGQGAKMTSMKLRLGTDSSNYFEYDIDNIGANFEDCWNYESVILNDYTTSAGSPSLTTIAWLQIEIICSASIAASSIFFDHMTATTGSFTIKSAERGSIKFPDVRVPYQTASQITEDLAKKSSLFWFIDHEKDIHVFTATTTPAPWGITDSSLNYTNLSIEVDMSKLKNRQIIIGGEAPSAVLYTQPVLADGTQTSFTLDYKYKSLTMTVDGTPQTLGVENFADPTTVQWIWNFEEKVLKQATASTPTAGQAIVFTGYPYEPIRVSVTSPTSIAAMVALTGGDGIYDGAPISDSSLSSFEDARIRGRAELTQWANAIVSAKFYTDNDGLRSGQSISIVDSTRSVSDSFLIQTIQWQQVYGARFKYSVLASSTLFGLIEFIQLLLRRSSKLSVNPSELVDTILNVDETITITPSLVFTKQDKVVYAALKKAKVIDFIGLSGSTTSSSVIDSGKQWYAEFSGSETGTAEFTTSNHSNNAELRLTTAVGGNSKELQVRNTFRFSAVASTLYTVDAWTEIQTALSNLGTGGGFQLVIEEYAAQTGGSVLATNTIFSEVTSVHDFVKRSATFTTNASTAWFTVKVSLYRSLGTARLTDIKLTPATTETATLAGYASFSQAT